MTYAAEMPPSTRNVDAVTKDASSEAKNAAAAAISEGSDDASFVTGSTFLVDGGISAAYVTPL